MTDLEREYRRLERDLDLEPGAIGRPPRPAPRRGRRGGALRAYWMEMDAAAIVEEEGVTLAEARVRVVADWAASGD